jgi:Tol biopolymer transport system component
LQVEDGQSPVAMLAARHDTANAMNPWHPDIQRSSPMNNIARRAASLALLILILLLVRLLPRPGPITPDTIRVQSTEGPGEGQWVVMPGFRELGSPCLSPDGEWIAFDAYKEGYNNSPSECWIARKDGTGLRKLTDGATPRWSPDGQRLLFIRGVETDPKQEPDIYVMKSDGTRERKLGPGRWPDWSPDGRRIVFSRGGQPGGGVKVGATVYTSDADGSGRNRLCDGDCPSWSPDGKKIAYCLKDAGRAPVIFVRDLLSGKQEMLGIGWYRANWMPDSTTLVANGYVGWKECMVRLSPDSPERPEELATEFERPSSPCCSRDGKQIVFIAKRPAERPR